MLGVLGLALIAGPMACSRDRSEPLPAEPKPPAPSAAAAALEPGLEVVSWACGVDDLTLGSVLAPLQRESSLSESMTRLWSANGLRILSVPVERVPALQDALGAQSAGAGGAQRQWLGQALVWTPLFLGPGSDAPRTIATDADRLRLGPGQLRLLARSWLAPASLGQSSPTSMPAVLNIELVPQHREAPSSGRRENLLAQPSIAAEDQGLVFRRLLLALQVRRGVALLIVPERPEVVWASSYRARAGDDDAGAPTSPVRAAAPGPSVPTLGEDMMMGARPLTPGANASTPRSVVLLLPRVPETFTLGR